MRCSSRTRSACLLVVLVGVSFVWGSVGLAQSGATDSAPDAGSDDAAPYATLSPPCPKRCVPEIHTACEPVTLEVDEGLSASDIRGIRRALALRRPEVILSIHFIYGSRSRVQVTTNVGARCLSYGSFYAAARTKNGWRRDTIGVGVP
jgi:hypothetical protein